jgi:hypothetical protein
MHFDSYLHIEDMASLAVQGDDIQSQVEEASNKILAHIDASGLIATTPVFTMLKGDDTLLYSVVKIGYGAKGV